MAQWLVTVINYQGEPSSNLGEHTLLSSFFIGDYSSGDSRYSSLGLPRNRGRIVERTDLLPCYLIYVTILTRWLYPSSGTWYMVGTCVRGLVRVELGPLPVYHVFKIASYGYNLIDHASLENYDKCKAAIICIC